MRGAKGTEGGILGLEMDGEGDVSDGREGGSWCGAGTPGVRRSRGRWRGGGGAAGPPRSPASHELVPARESKCHDVRAARVAEMATGVVPAAGPGVPPLTVAIKVHKT